MNKKTAILTFASLIIFASPVLGLEATRSTTPIKERIDTRIDTRKEAVQAKMEGIKAKMVSREATLKLKLESFRDKKKATAAARINTNLNNINTRHTEMMQKNLDNMTAILNKLENRVNEGKPDIKDSANAKVAITNARNAISSASAAVTVQSEKDYTIQVTSENKVRLDALSQRELLYKDLMTLRKVIIDTKQTVMNAIRVARAEKQEVTSETKKEGTVSGQL